jgi:nucleotide-binding universal stress UspA family protein
MGHIKNILAAVNGSPSSLAALDEAVSLAEDLGAHVDVLHVAPSAGSKGAPPSVTEKVGLEEITREMEHAIDVAKGRLGDRLDRREASGEPVRTILETAVAARSDLIVIGTHGRLGRLHELAGSVAATLVRSAPCPVMTVHMPDGEEESFSERIHGRQPLSTQVRPGR